MAPRIGLALCAAVLALATLPGGARALVAGQSVADGRFRATTVARLDFATGMQFTPSGDRLFVNERSGRIRIVQRGRLLPQPFATVRTNTSAESGLLGLALHPKFEDGEPWVYVFYTAADGGTDLVERFRADGNRSVERDVVFDGMPAAFWHHGGIVAFGPDGKLYVSNGEQHVRERAQNPRVLGGKIYRLNPDGSIPADNPFRGEPTFAYGLRNPFGMAFDPRSGLLWSTENGPSDHDEVNLIERGKNYGWPVVKGKAGDRRYVDPVLDYVNIIVPTMMAFGGDALPSEYRGNLFFGSFRQEGIHRVQLTANRRGARTDRIFVRAGEGVVGMTMGPDGLYYSTPTEVVRVAAASGPSPSPSPPASPSPSPDEPSPSPSPTTALASPPADEGGIDPAPVAIVGVIGVGLAATIALLVRRARS